MNRKKNLATFASLDLVDYLPLELIHIPPLSASLHYAHAIFEGMSLIKLDDRLQLFHPWMNLQRMRAGAREMGIGMEPFSDEKIIGNIFALAAMNGFHHSGCKSPVVRKAGKRVNRYYVRPLLFVESDNIGLGATMRPRFLTSISPMGNYLRYDKRKGASVMLFPSPRLLPFPSIKTSSNYQLGIVSRTKMREYNKKNSESCLETLFVNAKGDLIEGSGENIVLLRDGRLITPPPKDGALPGITVNLVGMIAKKLGLDFTYGTFNMQELGKGDALFLTGNAAGIVPISSICVPDNGFRTSDKHNFSSARNTQLRRIAQEYELMEIGYGEYMNLHESLESWIGSEEQDRLYSCGRRFWEKVGRAERKGLSVFPSNRPAPQLLSDNMPWVTDRRFQFGGGAASQIGSVRGGRDGG